MMKSTIILVLIIIVSAALGRSELTKDELFENEIKNNMHMLKTYDNAYNFVHSASYYSKIVNYSDSVPGEENTKQNREYYRTRYTNIKRNFIRFVRKDDIMHNIFMKVVTAETPYLGPTTLFVTVYVKLLALRYSVTFRNCAIMASIYPNIYVSSPNFQFLVGLRSMLGIFLKHERLAEVEEDCDFVGNYLYWFASVELHELMNKFDEKFCREFEKKQSARGSDNSCKMIVEKLRVISDKIGKYQKGNQNNYFQKYAADLPSSTTGLQKDISQIVDGFENEYQINFYHNMWDIETEEFGKDILQTLSVFRNIFYGTTKLRTALSDEDLQLFKPKDDNEALSLWAQASHLATNIILKDDAKTKKRNFESDKTFQYEMYQSIGVNVIRTIELERVSLYKRAMNVDFDNNSKKQLTRGYDGFFLHITIHHTSNAFPVRCNLRSYSSLHSITDESPPNANRKDAETKAKNRCLNVPSI